MSNGGSSFPAAWPVNCPPNDATDARGTVYRTVRTNPPTADDFRSFREEGKHVRDPQKQCQACGISVLRTREDAVHHRDAFQWRGEFIAEGMLAPAHGKIKPTPAKKFPSHISWWCYDGVARHEIFVVIVGL